jgi:hypothetical protein
LKRYIFCSLIFVFSLTTVGQAADPPVFLNAGDEGKKLLDSLEQSRSTDTLSMAILAFNHAFFDTTANGFKEKAHHYFRQMRSSALTKAYLQATELLDIRDASTLDIFLSIFSGGPYDKARDVLKKINTIRRDNPGNDTILFLATACNLEAAKHMCDCMLESSQDLALLRSTVSYDDTTKQFFLNLFEAKFCWLYSKCYDRPQFKTTAQQYLDQAEKWAYNSYHRHELGHWRNKIGLPKTDTTSEAKK